MGRIVALLLLASAPVWAAPGDVLTQHYDTARSGATLGETRLTTSNVTPPKFGKLFARTVDGALYAQPLYLHGVSIAGGVHDVVYLATMHNRVYAFDAVDPAAAAPLWQVALEPSSPLPDANIGFQCGTYRDISTEIGIISTPVIDPARGVLYVVDFTRSGSGDDAVYAHWLHAVDLHTGAERLGGPVQIAAAVSGSGDGSDDGVVAFASRFQNQRASLLEAAGRLYIAFASYCDSGPYHGWVLAYDAATLAPLAAFNDTPNGSAGGIWMSGQGPALDPDDGSVYVTTGNGTVLPPPDGVDFGNAFVKLDPATLGVVDWFIPFDYAALNAADLDLGSTGVLVIPGTQLIMGGGKGGKLYVLDRSGLGHLHAGDDSQIVQTLAITNEHLHGSTVSWNGPFGLSIYMWGEQDTLKRFDLGAATFGTQPASQSTMSAGPGMPGGILSLSASDATAGSGIVWANLPIDQNANQQVVPGLLRAFDAADLRRELWNSERDAARDSFGNFAKFTSAVVVDGRVYLGTFSDQLVVYGLLASATVLESAQNPARFGEPVTLTATSRGPAFGVPTGRVAFLEGGTALGSAQLAGARGTIQVALAVGDHVLTASYGGDSSFNPSDSAALVQTVQRALPGVTLDAQPAAAVFPQSVLLTVTVRGAAAATPSGTVDFSDGTTALGTALVDAGGAAQLEVALHAGAHALAAVYSGDDHYEPATAPLPITVARGATTVGLEALPAQARAGQSVRLVAQVGATFGAAPAGVVQFRDGTTVLGLAALDAARRAVLVVSLAAGSHPLSASFAGDSDDAESASPTLMLAVTAAPPPDAAAAPADLAKTGHDSDGGCGGGGTASMGLVWLPLFFSRSRSRARRRRAALAAVLLLIAGGTARAAPEITQYDGPAPIVTRLLGERPRVIAFGEYHQTKGGSKAPSALAHFAGELFALVRPRSSDLIVETWITEGKCGATEEKAVASVKQSTQRPEATEDELVTLLKRAKAEGVAPHILTLSCAEYLSIQPVGGEVDYVKLLGVVTDQLHRQIRAVLAAQKKGDDRVVLVYGGALHNDLHPRRELAAFSFGPAVRKEVGGRYLEVDLYVPEYIESDKEIVAEPWYARYRKQSPARWTVVRRGPGSYIVVLPRSALQ